MDSSNSGSFQSSSGGGAGGGGGGVADIEEYDSRTQSISSFFNPSNHFNPNLNHLLQQQQQQQKSHHHHRPPPADTTFFNPSSTSSFSPNLNPHQDPGPANWTGATCAPVRPDQNLSGFDSYPVNHNSSTIDTNTKMGRGSDHHHHHVGVTTKNPKKRTRASRRAPTTVLTTDTTNFRQMVQEFTGIPTAPFATAPFSRRLDPFGRGSDGAGGTTGSLYPLRPSPQKVQQQPPPFLNSTANIVESGSTSNNITTATTSSNYNLPPSSIHEFQRQPSTLLDLQNPMLSFQSLLQTSLAHDSSGLQNSSKRWRGQDEKLESFEDVIGNNQNIGGSKLNSGLENVVSSRSGGDQVQGNESSWICPSN